MRSVCSLLSKYFIQSYVSAKRQRDEEEVEEAKVLSITSIDLVRFITPGKQMVVFLFFFNYFLSCFDKY